MPFDFQFGFYEKGGAFTMVNNPKTPDCSVSGACDSGVITENQLIGVNNSDLAVGFYNDSHGDSHGYTFNIATNTFSADINDPLAVSTVTAAINNSDEDRWLLYRFQWRHPRLHRQRRVFQHRSIRLARPRPSCWG